MYWIQTLYLKSAAQNPPLIKVILSQSITATEITHQHSHAQILFQGVPGGKLPEGETMGFTSDPNSSLGAGPLPSSQVTNKWYLFTGTSPITKAKTGHNQQLFPSKVFPANPPIYPVELGAVSPPRSSGRCPGI